jgi:hypothetical protein
LEAATAVVENMIDGLAPSGYMRYAPDGISVPSRLFLRFLIVIALLGHFVFASFASAFLLKVHLIVPFE